MALSNTEKYQIATTKFQGNLKYQYLDKKMFFEFWILVIAICLRFVICYLKF